MASISYIHQNNLTTKLKNNFKNKKTELQDFYSSKYIPLRKEIDTLTFNQSHQNNFDIAAELLWNYYCDLRSFAKENEIDERSKFSSSFLEEISIYLFKDLPIIKNEKLNIFCDTGVYTGLSVDNKLKVSITTKKIDFCIGHKTTIKIDNTKERDIILPIVAVEVKTYLDATMFGEVQYSSSKLRAIAPYAKLYVLMLYKDLKDEHIISARANTSLNEMFVLKKEKIKKDTLPQKDDADRISGEALFSYWTEIVSAVENASLPKTVDTPGKLLNIKKP